MRAVRRPVRSSSSRPTRASSTAARSRRFRSFRSSERVALGFASDEATVVQIKHLLGVFARHIGNRAHAVVDRAHLREIADQLAQLAASIADVAAPVVATIAVRRQLVTALLDELDAAAAAPPSAEARALLAANLAARANQQFRLHKVLV